jgi:hypothetical protein
MSSGESVGSKMLSIDVSDLILFLCCCSKDDDGDDEVVLLFLSGGADRRGDAADMIADRGELLEIISSGNKGDDNIGD